MPHWSDAAAPQAGAREVLTPEVVAPRSMELLLPGFPEVAHRVDAFARRVPWWVWLVAGYLARGWYQARRQRSSDS